MLCVMVAVAGMLGLRARAYMAKRAAYMQQRSISTPSTPGIATEAPKAFKGSGRGGMPIPGEIPGGPKPIVYRGMVLNSKVRVASRSCKVSRFTYSQAPCGFRARRWSFSTASSLLCRAL